MNRFVEWIGLKQKLIAVPKHRHSSLLATSGGHRLASPRFPTVPVKRLRDLVLAAVPLSVISPVAIFQNPDYWVSLSAAVTMRSSTVYDLEPRYLLYATALCSIMSCPEMTDGTVFFFHVRDGDTLLKDDGEGQEFPNLEAVRLEAIQAARDILSEAALSGHPGSLDQQIEVVDEADRTVVTMRVGRAIGTESQT